MGILFGGASATGTRDPAASLFAELGPGVNTGLAMLLPRDSNDPVPPVTVDLLFRDSNGQVQGTGQQVLQEGQKVAAFIDQFVAPQGSGPSGLQQPFSGSVDVLVSGEPCDPYSEFNPNLPCFISLLPLRQEGLVLTTQLVFPPRRDTSDFPLGQGGLQNVATQPSPPRTGVANPCALPALFAPDALYRAYFIAQFGHGSIPSANPANTLEFDTVVKFLNLADEEVEEGVFEARETEFEIVTCSEEGEPLNMMAVPAGPQGHLTTSYITKTIPPNDTFQVNSLNDNPDSQIDVGYAIVRSLGFVVPEVIFNIRRGNGFLTSTNVPILPILTATSFFADIDEATPLNTGIAFFFPSEFDTLGGDPPEPGVVRAMIELFLLDEQGEIVAETEFTVDRGHKTDDFLGQFFAGQLGDITQPFQGSLEIRASHPVAILPLRQEGLVLTTQALFPPRVLRSR